MKTQIIIALVITAALMAVSALGLPETLGAHPFWAVKTGIMGSVAGLLIYAAARLAKIRPRYIALIGGAALILSVVAAIQGKSIFAASYAENALAGKFWYFGWLGIWAALGLMLCAVLIRKQRR